MRGEAFISSSSSLCIKGCYVQLTFWLRAVSLSFKSQTKTNLTWRAVRGFAAASRPFAPAGGCSGCGKRAGAGSTARPPGSAHPRVGPPPGRNTPAARARANGRAYANAARPALSPAPFLGSHQIYLTVAAGSGSAGERAPRYVCVWLDLDFNVQHDI